MAPTRLDQLPHELIAYIATSCSATSALQLSATCRTIREICHNGRIYKAILLSSIAASAHSEDTCIDIDAIARRCASDASAWARYAVADEMVQTRSRPWNRLDSNEGSDRATSCWSSWLPELLLVRHHMIDAFDWKYVYPPGAHEHIDQSPYNKLCWCITVTSLAQNKYMFSIERDERAQYLSRTFAAELSHLQSLHSSIAILRRMLAGINSRANSLSRPCVPIPSIQAIDLCSSGPHDTMPLPFDPDAGSWNRWHEQRHHDLIHGMTTGSWQGYYCYTRFYIDRLDEPMRDIIFTAPDAARPLHVVAEGCVDEFGGFSIEGDLVDEKDQGVTFSATKRYGIGGPNWAWDLKLTSFGLIGFWGDDPTTSMGRYGSIWLWKKRLDGSKAMH